MFEDFVEGARFELTTTIGDDVFNKLVNSSLDSSGDPLEIADRVDASFNRVDVRVRVPSRDTGRGINEGRCDGLTSCSPSLGGVISIGSIPDWDED